MAKLSNITESAAQQALEQIILAKIIDGQDISTLCFCPQCWADILSLALNNLPPRYVVSEEGEAITRATLELDAQYKARVYTEVTKALLQVSANPHHKSN